MLRFTGSLLLCWGIARVVMVLEKNSLKTDAVSLAVSAMLPSSLRE